MQVYNIAICDNDVGFAKSMTEQCKNIMDKWNIHFSIKRLYSCEEVLRDYARGGRADMMFINTTLGRKSGIDLTRRLKERGCASAVVLMAEDTGFLLDGYEVQPAYFLLKPIDTERLERAFKIGLKLQTEQKILVLKCDRQYMQVPIESILYIEAFNHGLTVHTRSRDYQVRMTFSQIMEELPPLRFARCHNSYVVNLARVSNFSRTDGVTLDCRVTLPLGRKYFEEFKQSFTQFIDTC